MIIGGGLGLFQLLHFSFLFGFLKVQFSRGVRVSVYFGRSCATDVDATLIGAKPMKF